MGIHSFGHDEALLELVDTINLACGLHAGGPQQMADTVGSAVAAGVSIGAHPGLPDIGWLRPSRHGPDVARGPRPGALSRWAPSAGFLADAGSDAPPHQAPRRALRHGRARRAADGGRLRRRRAVRRPVLGLPGTTHERVAARRGVAFVAEFYVDLDYADDGTLVITRHAGERDLAEVERRARRAIDERDDLHRERPGSRRPRRVAVRALRPTERPAGRRSAARAPRTSDPSGQEGATTPA